MSVNIPALSTALINETQKIIIGKPEQIKLIVVSILANGHILVDDIPGTGKTTLVKTLAIALGCDFKRVQFTPDLLPSDILGTNIYDQKMNDFRFIKGPVNTNILLADEINRAIPRTQSALLEAMEEGQTTVDGVASPLPHPFIVLATQNPVESESTFRLPAAQMDRFFIKLSLGYPTKAEEASMLENLGDKIPFSTICAVTTPVQISEAQKAVESVFVSNFMRDYIVSIVSATRENSMFKSGASPRASRSLYKGAKVMAAISGRDFVVPEDIFAIALPILSHRVTLNSEAKFSGKKAEDILAQIIKETPTPPLTSEVL